MHEMAHDNIWQITTLSSHETFTILRIEFITTTFNTTTIKVVHVIAIYKPSTLLFSTFINQLQKRLDVMPTFCPTVIMGDFNIDMFDENSTQPNELKFFYEPIFNGTLVLKNYNNLWYPYWSHMDKCTHPIKYFKSCWSILD